MENYYMIGTMPGIMGGDNSQVGCMTSLFAHNPIDEIKLIMVKQTKKAECYKKPNRML